MKPHGLIFRADEVRAILDGRKTQDRRLVRPQPDVENVKWELRDGMFHPLRDELCRGVLDPVGPALKAPIHVGDIIWVRETFRLYDSPNECACYDECGCSQFHGKLIYRADLASTDDKWIPSIHMPHWASRIDLEVTAVRVERVQDISEEDAIAEGCDMDGSLPRQKHHSSGIGMVGWDSAVEWYSDVWDSIHSNWDTNPFVWVREFRRVK